ncbi:Nitric oxide dioxygenase [Sphingobium herbicidovorans NBRC 16415]|uniref:Nitric oxide dioxygenase n=1 Tax=Sphingobium herbicidovorans (strain ATCC 700291 / DSM 11019 / CCUG 56400 / KCTC 2939 / LMG 18315 / NBRC 16415 / MH) TaxID=1219045 RepID=A0A086P9P8_SPHHM|nr:MULTISPECIES: globin domain-containing protein [Sphingobium]AMK17846.1 nitric oxide dioxygenase [Sphingobium sp. MI1205]KFG90116.1 Nitric oxide dioxygenase [Sphingobium herbicidovorans NBRC 16415]
MSQLTAETIAIVKATAPALRSHGVEITTAMYARLFQDASIKDMFDQAAQESGEQPKRLAAAILGYAENIDKLQALEGAVARMVQRHVETGVKPEHYPKVAAALLPAIRDVLGEEVATDAVLDAWGKAYWFLAEILIGKEAQAYEDAEAA